jgi:16S rRNA G966 N2-methylase RsmD
MHIKVAEACRTPGESISSEYQLFRIVTTDRAGVASAVSAVLANRGVNIECFAGSGLGAEAGERHGKFLVIVEADHAYGTVLRKLLLCLEVVSEIEGPQSLSAEEMAEWRARFASL